MRRFMQWLIAYAFAVASAVLACTYGFMSAAGFYGYGKAFILCLVAFGGCHGPAYISNLRKAHGWSGAGLAITGTAFCLLVTLWGGLGTIASGGAEVRAERTKASGDTARDRDALRRLQTERDALGTPRPAAAISADLATARSGIPYKATDGCEPENITVAKTREFCANYRKLEAELAAAKTAARLDAEAGTVTQRLAHAPADLEADPQAAAFSRLTGLTLELSAALYALAASIALELMGMVAMMVAWTERHAPIQTPDAPEVRQRRTTPAAYRVPEPLAPTKTVDRTNVVEMQRPAVFGSIKKFVLACMVPAADEKVEVRALLTRYEAWCRESGIPPADLHKFLDEIEGVCRKAGISIEPIEGQVYAVGVKLSA